MRADIEARRPEIEALCRRFAVNRLELFGSAAAASSWRPDSDLDLLVEFRDPDSAGYADRYFGLLEALEQLFGRPIDLVVDAAIKNPYFRQSVARSKALLYAALVEEVPV